MIPPAGKRTNQSRPSERSVSIFELCAGEPGEIIWLVKLYTVKGRIFRKIRQKKEKSKKNASSVYKFLKNNAWKGPVYCFAVLNSFPIEPSV